MISIKLEIEEKKGQVAVRMDAPPQPNATAQETLHASVLCKAIRMGMQALQQTGGRGGIIVEQSVVKCPKCGKEHRKQSNIVLYTCGCGQSFGA